MGNAKDCFETAARGLQIAQKTSDKCVDFFKK